MPRAIVDFMRQEMDYPIDERMVLKVFEEHGEEVTLQALRDQRAEMTQEAYGAMHPALQPRDPA